MNYLKFIQKECLSLKQGQDSKENILKKITAVAKQSPSLDLYDEEVIFNAFCEREALSSTGFAKGIAIPHCKLKGLNEFIIGAMTIPEGTDFKALDGQKTTLLIFIIAPEEKRNEHIHILSSLSKSFRTLEEIQKASTCEKADDLYQIFKDKNTTKEDAPKIIEFSRIEVFIQDEEKFTDILEIFSECDNCSVSITEANNCGFYLNSMPLFASFWNDENEKQSHKIINAVVNKSLANDLIRKIQTHRGDITNNPGIMILLHDLGFKVGDLNL